MSWLSDIFGGSEKQTTTQQNDIRQLPDYAESEGARGDWYSKLQEWGQQPGYGAVMPNFSDIWNNVKGKVNQYYWGGPEQGSGLAGKVKSNLAQRGMSDQPAAEQQLMDMGFSEKNTLQDIAIQQAMEEANLSESGRKTWLNSLQQLAGMKPSFQSYGATQTTSTPDDSPFSYLTNLFSNSNNNSTTKMLGDYLTGTQKQDAPTVNENIAGTPASNLGKADSNGSDWLSMVLKMAPQILSMVA